MFRRILRALGLIRGEEKPVAAPVAPIVAAEQAEPLMSIDDQIVALRAKYEKAYPKQKKRHHKQRLRA